MPTWVHPILRARQEALEAEGLIQKQDTVLVTNFKNQEAQGLRTKVVPNHIIVLRGNLYRPS
jgi:hypothetical protein